MSLPSSSANSHSSKPDSSLAARVPETAVDRLAPLDTFARRHNGPDAEEIAEMLDLLDFSTLDQLVDATVPAKIRLEKPLDLPPAASESTAPAELRALASQNQVFRSYIGMGYYDTLTPGVIQRTILENPGWYTAYTP